MADVTCRTTDGLLPNLPWQSQKIRSQMRVGALCKPQVRRGHDEGARLYWDYTQDPNINHNGYSNSRASLLLFEIANHLILLYQKYWPSNLTLFE